MYIAIKAGLFCGCTGLFYENVNSDMQRDMAERAFSLSPYLSLYLSLSLSQADSTSLSLYIQSILYLSLSLFTHVAVNAGLFCRCSGPFYENVNPNMQRDKAERASSISLYLSLRQGLSLSLSHSIENAHTFSIEY